MAILIDETKRVLVQGMTGREGQARTRLMREYGTNVVGGVTPGKGGQSVLGIPVFNTPKEAVAALGAIDISVLFVPASGVKDAAIAAIDAGIKLMVLVPDRVPVWDAMEIAAASRANGARFLGPNTLGVLSPGRGVVGEEMIAIGVGPVIAEVDHGADMRMAAVDGGRTGFAGTAFAAVVARGSQQIVF